MKVDTLQAGRDLDILVAEKVLGCKVSRSPVAMRCHCTCPVIPGSQSRPHDDDNEHSCWLKFYSTEMSAAWEVVEKLGLIVGPNPQPLKGWIAQDSWDAKTCTYTLADTAPLAICRLALMRVGA